VLLRGGTLLMAYVYPPQMRATRDLLRRRMYLMRKRSELLGCRFVVRNTNQIEKVLLHFSQRLRPTMFEVAKRLPKAKLPSTPKRAENYRERVKFTISSEVVKCRAS